MSVCYCGGKYVCAKHREAPAPKLDINARRSTPEETAFVRDILRIVASPEEGQPPDIGGVLGLQKTTAEGALK